MYRFSLVVALFLALGCSARADTLFSLNNATFESGATITGTIAINTTTGQFMSANLVYSLGAMTAVFNGPFSNWGETFDMTQFFGDVYNANGDLFLIDLPVSWIMHYTGGPICSNANLCDDFTGYFQSASGDIDPSASGLLVPAVVTPEPATLLLFGTGFSGAFALARRKRRKHDEPSGTRGEVL